VAIRGEVAKALAALRAAYPRQTITAKQYREMIKLWTEILEDVPGEALMVAVKAWISGDSPWMPSVGQVRQAALDLAPRTGAPKTAGDAWEEVRRALGRGEHGYRKGHYRWSGELVERAFDGVGGWRYFNQALIDSVMADRAHFMRIYNDLLEREEKARREAPVVAAYRRALLAQASEVEKKTTEVVCEEEQPVDLSRAIGGLAARWRLQEGAGDEDQAAAGAGAGRPAGRPGAQPGDAPTEIGAGLPRQ
jgi:hypothetical protein